MYDDILLFVKIVESGKFSQAAKELGLSQSTISRKIEQLEQDLNFRLLKRDARTMELTDKGLQLYEGFKNCAKEVAAKCQQALNQSSEVVVESSEFNVLLPLGFYHSQISQALVSVVHEYPNFLINIRNYVYDFDFSKAMYDMAIVSHVILAVTNTQLHAKLIHSSRLVLVCTHEYVQKFGQLTECSEVSQHLIIGRAPPPNQPAQNVIRLFRDGQEQELVLNPRLRVGMNNFIEVRSMVDSGVAIGSLPAETVADGLASGQLIQLLPDYHAGIFAYYLVSKLKDSDPRYQLLYGIIQSCLGAQL